MSYNSIPFFSMISYVKRIITNTIVDKCKYNELKKQNKIKPQYVSKS